MVLKRLLRFERHVCGFTSYFFLFLLTFVTILLTFLMKTSRVETRSLPALARCYPRSFTFYVAHPARSILTSSFFLLPFFCASAVTPQSEQASGITAIVQKAMKTEHLRAVIVKVTQGDKVVISQAFGESMTGVPAITAMHFRNGAVHSLTWPHCSCSSWTTTRSSSTTRSSAGCRTCRKRTRSH